jgi:hypothetical protein
MQERISRALLHIEHIFAPAPGMAESILGFMQADPEANAFERTGCHIEFKADLRSEYVCD